MALPYSTRASWVVKSITSTKTSTADLKPFELGIFDYSGKAVAGFQNSPYIYFAVGSPNQQSRISSSPKVRPLLDRNSTVSFKSDKMYGKELLPARIGKPKKRSTPMTITIGYDGINDCSNLDFDFGKTYMLTTRLYGSAAKSVFGKEVQDTITVTLPAKDACDTSCTKANLGYMVIDELVTKYNNSWISPAVRAEKLMDCCDDVALTKFYCREWTITLCDEGNELTLARLQKQYSQKIYIKSRVGSMTTYAFVQAQTDTAPVDYSSKTVYIPDCENCTAGFTTTDAYKTILVSINTNGLDDTPAEHLATVQAVISTATEAVKTGYAFGTSSYVVSVPTNWVMPAAIANVTITDTGKITPKYCVQTTPVTTAWASGKQTYRIKRTLKLTVDNPDCEGSDLAAIVGAYTKATDVVPGSVALQEAGTCKSIFTLDQYSGCMEDGCNTLAVVNFKELPTFKGHTWGLDLCEGWTVVNDCPVPPAATPLRDCRVGIQLIGGFVDFANSTTIFNPDNAVNYDPIYFEVAISELMQVGEPGGIKPINAPISINRETSRKFLTGQEVIREIIEYRYYKQNEKFFNPDSFGGAYRYSEAEGQKFGVDANAFYYAVYINHDKGGRQWNHHMDMANKTELALYFAEEDYAVMVQFLLEYNKYATSAGVSLPTLVI